MSTFSLHHHVNISISGHHIWIPYCIICIMLHVSTVWCYSVPEPPYTILQEPTEGHPDFLVAEIHLPEVVCMSHALFTAERSTSSSNSSSCSSCSCCCCSSYQLSEWLTTKVSERAFLFAGPNTWNLSVRSLINYHQRFSLMDMIWYIHLIIKSCQYATIHRTQYI